MLIHIDLLEYTQPQPRIVRILWMDARQTMAYLFELHANSAHPELVTLAALVDDVHEQRSRLLLHTPYIVTPDPSTLPASRRQRGTFRLAVARHAATHPAFSRRGAYRQMLKDVFGARAGCRSELWSM